MENVPQVICPDFSKWQLKLESLGYKNYVEILNAKDYGIPQNRSRCFMVSILGEYSYKFPMKIKLKYKLNDLLEKNVDEKYYLSDKMINYITATNEKWSGNNNGAIVNRTIGCTLNTAPTQRRCDASNYIAEDLPEDTDLRKVNGGSLNNEPTFACDFRYDEGVRGRTDYNLCPTITTRSSGYSGIPLISNKKLRKKKE